MCSSKLIFKKFLLLYMISLLEFRLPQLQERYLKYFSCSCGNRNFRHKKLSSIVTFYVFFVCKNIRIFFERTPYTLCKQNDHVVFILCRIHFCSVGSVSLLNSFEVYLPEKPPKHFMVYLTHSVGNNSAGRTNSLKFMKYIDVK